MDSEGPRNRVLAVALTALSAVLAGCPFGPSNFEPLDLPYCLANERVESGRCVACAEGGVAEAGALKSGPDTQCECSDGFEVDDADPTGNTCRTERCRVDQRVLDGACADCAPGLENPVRDDPMLGDTSCTVVICGPGERVRGNRCAPCPALSVSDAMNEASGPDTMCDCVPGSTRAGTSPDDDCVATVCGIDERVASNTCVACDEGFVNPPHRADPALPPVVATSTDTACTADDCFAELGVLCRDFEEAALEGDSPLPEDNFGFAVAMSGDFLAVGAPNEVDDTGDRNGVVRIFRRDGATWTLDDRIEAPALDVGTPPSFGASLAFNNGTLIVGAPDADESRGVVYAFARTEGAAESSWGSPVARLQPVDDLNRFDRFGDAVAVDGSTIAVGAPGAGVGAVFVFVPLDVPNRWGAPVRVAPSASEQFGDSVALANGRLVVGAPGDRNGRGNAYVYDESGDDWLQAFTLTASTSEVDAAFGSAVAFDGDWIAVGAPLQDGGTGVVDVGAVYLYDGRSGAFVQSVRATAQAEDDRFGQSVALADDLMAVGTPLEDRGAGDFGVPNDDRVANSGAAYVFGQGGGVWGELVYIKAIEPTAGEEFGSAVTVDGRRVAIGARQDNVGGGAYVRVVRPE